MATLTQSPSQESEYFGADIMSEISNNVPGWSDLIDTVMPRDDKVGIQQYMSTEQYIDQMPMPPPYHGNSNIPLTYIPSRDDYPGDRNFEVILSNDVTGANCMFSAALGKVFINTDQTLPIRFKWKATSTSVYLRGMIVYSNDQYRAEPITRCLNHQSEDTRSNRNINPSMIDHVVRCTDPQTVYAELNNHKCIIVPLGTPQHGCDYVHLAFKFYCKNSCVGGMNRRCTGVVFTLEDDDGNVLGRRFLPVRVCSCPKRDKEKEEEGVYKKTNKQLVQTAKKRKITPKIQCSAGKRPMSTMTTTMTHLIPAQIDNREFNLTVRVLGRDNAIATLKAAHGAMSSSATTTEQFAPFKPYLRDIEKHIEQLQ